MIYTIRNNELSVAVSDLGAELQNITDRKSGEEYLWQGDPAVWSGRSPILFPVVGKLKDNTYRYRGRAYTMPKHGFAKKSVFTAALLTPDSLTMTLTSGTFDECYPFRFRLEITYTLSGRELCVTYRVRNDGDDDMYFSLGAHPAFNCAMGDCLRFPDDAEAAACRLSPETMLLGTAPEADAIRDHTLTIEKETFAKDALIFKGLRSGSATLYHGGAPRVSVDYGSAPCLGVWAKPGADYVCIEPWYGVDDDALVSGDIETKPYINRLAGGAWFRFPMTIRLF